MTQQAVTNVAIVAIVTKYPVQPCCVCPLAIIANIETGFAYFEKSALYISHRLSSCQFCDRIIVIKEGNIIEEGTHKQLIDRGGYYAHLYGLQSSYYNNES